MASPTRCRIRNAAGTRGISKISISRDDDGIVVVRTGAKRRDRRPAQCVLQLRGMAPVEERVAGLEARMDEHKDQIVNLREEVQAFRGETRAEFAAVRTEMRAEFGAVRTEMRTEFAAVRAEMASGDAALRSTMERGFERLDQKIDKHFMWLLGVMLTGFFTGFGAIITMLVSILERLP